MVKVLCVDDDEDILEYLSDTLVECKFDVTTRMSADEALELGDALRDFQLIFTDIKMPGTNGFEFISKLRKAGIENPIIAISGIADLDKSIFPDGYRPTDDSYKPTRFLRKPFTYTDILTELKLMNFL